MKTKLAILAVAIATSASCALAADMPQAYSRAPVAVSPAYDWTGFYLGAMGGYGFSDNASVNGFATTNAGLKGGFAGATLGANYQIGQFVFGIEDDFAWSGIGKTWPATFGVAVQDRMLAFGTITGRAGFAANNVLFYGKGGYAYMLNELSGTGFGATVWERRYHSGWTIGAGLEYAFAGTWSAKVEYMFAQYLASPYILLNNATLAADVHTIKAGINYRFGWAGQPVTARY
jgi:outer membrane immunogenic protein